MDLLYPVYLMSEIKLFVCLFVCQLVHDLNIFQFPHVGFMDPYNLT